MAAAVEGLRIPLASSYCVDLEMEGRFVIGRALIAMCNMQELRSHPP